MKGIVITPENEISVKDFCRPLYQTAGEVVGGYIEHVHPRLLPEPFCMIVNEEGLLQSLPVNPVGCFLYETLSHGWPIVGTIVIMKDGVNEDGEMDIIGLSDDEIKYMCDKLKGTFELKGEITL